jgi:hypothetical protein
MTCELREFAREGDMVDDGDVEFEAIGALRSLIIREGNFALPRSKNANFYPGSYSRPI